MVSGSARRLLLLLASLLSLSLSMGIAQATELEKWLVMPGEVISLHADIEAECQLCHEPLSAGQQGELCVDCHTEIGSDIDNAGGFHGRIPEQTQLECADCHTEHEGRDAMVVQLDEATFDHSLTDFILRDGHVGVPCADCHEPDVPRRQAVSACVGCHLDDDIHRGQRGEDCADCHNENDWSEVLFDHASTPFPLTGGHAEVGCDSCHLSPELSDVGKTCVACHRSDDVHKGQNGADCASCHVTENWSSATFDHFVVSGFRLSGGHDNLTCAACHSAPDHSDLSDASCQSCHSGDDIHEGRFGSDCASCHTVSRWSPKQFDHNAETGFALPQGHEDLSCASCHSGNLTDPISQDCGTCHQDDDPHRGQLGASCESCHVSDSWTAQTWFDHDLASFPLIGEHAELECASCHETAAFHDAGSACISCHVGDDPHQLSLGESCDDCHNPASWQNWLFEHETATGFALTGAHTLTGCNDCHTQAMTPAEPLSNECNSCHRRDDVHNGRFGKNCDVCHTTDSFSQLGAP